MSTKEAWEADRLRTERVRAISEGEPLDEAFALAVGAEFVHWWGVSKVRSITDAALAHFRKTRPECVQAFAQRLLDEVAPWATAHDWGIDLCSYEFEAREVRSLGSETVLRITAAPPAATVRAIILALPERDT